jgi:hypothetical protein
MQIDVTRSSSRPATTAICAQQDHVQFVVVDRISRLAARRLSRHGAARLADYGWQERAADFFCEAADFRVAVGLGGVAGEANRGAIKSL